MSRAVLDLAKLAEDELLIESASETLTDLKKRIVRERQDRLPELIEQEIAKLEAQTQQITESAGDAAAYKFFNEAIEKIQGVKPNSDMFRARKLYMQGRNAKEISDETGIPLALLNACIRNPASGWRLQRDRVFDHIGKELSRQSLPVLRDIHKCGLSLIKGAFENRAKEADEGTPVTLSESTQIAQTLAFISKELHLEEGEELDRAQKSLTPTEIFNAFLDDPYLGPAMKRLVNKRVPIEVEVKDGKQNRDTNGTQDPDGPQIQEGSPVILPVEQPESPGNGKDLAS